MVDKVLGDVVQSVREQAYSPPAVLQHRFRLDVFDDMASYEVAPDIRNHDDGKEILDKQEWMDNVTFGDY